MKKYVYLLILVLGFSNTALAGKIGVSLQAGVFETSAVEKENSTDSTADATVDTSASKDAEGLFGIASIFVEGTLPNDRVSLGLDFVPYALESETTDHKQLSMAVGGDGVNSNDNTESTVTNKVQVDFENLLTLYAKVDFDNSMYAKIGYMQVEAVTNEVLGTGGKYGDETLNGYTLGLGYEADLASGAFVRFEGSYMNIGGATFKNTVNVGTSVVVDDIEGYGAKVSVGRSF